MNQKKATAARTGKPMSEEHKAKIGEAQRAYWERARSGQGIADEKPKKPRGRPKGSKNKTSIEGA